MEEISDRGFRISELEMTGYHAKTQRRKGDDGVDGTQYDSRASRV